MADRVDGLSGVEVEPKSPRFDGLRTVHLEMLCSGATDGGLAAYLDATVSQPEYEVLAPAIQAWVEDAHG